MQLQWFQIWVHKPTGAEFYAWVPAWDGPSLTHVDQVAYSLWQSYGFPVQIVGAE